MRKLFSFFVALLATTCLWAEDFSVDGIYYNHLDGNNVEVTYRGNDYYSYEEYYGAVIIPASVTYNGTTYCVTSIGDYAFDDCYSLTSITIPNSVTSIGSYAFDDCDSLTSITIPNSVTSIGRSAFYGCSSLTSITIPNSVTSIGDYAFCYCGSLNSITIPNSVTSIGENAFQHCSSLTSITIPNSVTSIGKGAFSYCSSLTSVTIPNSVTSIGSYAFDNCDSLTSITIPNSVTSIGRSAFYGCSSLTSVTIPNSVPSIGDYAFQHCSSLTSVTIGNSVTSIGDYAFRDCSSLTSIVIPDGVTSIGDKAFSYCSSLTSVTIPNSVPSIGESAFDGCTALESVVWNAKNFANPANKEAAPFYDICSQIKSFTFGDSVEHIPAYLCYGMDKLTSVTTPNKLNTIGTSAFEGCIRLGKVSLGAAMENIAAYAFAGCTRLYDIYVYATYPPFAEESSFANYNVYVYIPCEYQRNYILDVVWGKFKFIECLESEETTTDGNVTVIPGTNDVTITWPTESNADTYTIVIKKDGEVFCTLTFNAEGQLLNIAFAPGRDGNHPAQYAEQAGKGYRFTVTSLESGTKYGYNIDVKDASNKTIKSHSGEFTTQSTTAVDNITTNNANIQKIIRDGQFIILRDGIEYNAIGQEL